MRQNEDRPNTEGTQGLVQTGLVGNRISYIAEERFLFRVSIVLAVKRRYRPGKTAAGGESDDASFSDV